MDLIAYHGTSTNPELIRQKGLYPPNFRAVADQILKQYSHRKLPKWVLKHVELEIQYRERQGSNVHLTLSWSQAMAYSGSPPGGEFAQLIDNLIRQGLRLKKRKLQFRRYVVTVRIPISKHVQDVRKRVREHGLKWHELRQAGGWDEMVPGVPPGKIIRITDVTDMIGV